LTKARGQRAKVRRQKAKGKAEGESLKPELEKEIA
jgi:hypothetical protein